MTHSESQEEERLSALFRYDVLDSPPEQSFDRITRLAKVVLQAPITIISLVDRDRQWFKSCYGLSVSETPREISFCTHAIEQDEPFVVNDALEDERFNKNPLVIGDPHIRFYLGVPLRTSDGYKLGTLCAIDQVPRTVSPEQIAVMEDLARLVVDELELRQIAKTDSLTGATTRRSFALATAKEFKRSQRYESPLSCISFDLDHFKSINDTFGHGAGDLVLQKVGEMCAETIRDVDTFGRLGGEEFSIALPETRLGEAVELAERLCLLIKELCISYKGVEIPVTASFGVTTLNVVDANFEELLKRADEALYDAKQNGRNCVIKATLALDATTVQDSQDFNIDNLRTG